MVFYISLSLVSIATMIWSAIQDVRERMIYVFPITMLHMMWSIYLYGFTDYPKMLLVTFWIVHLVLYVLLNKCSIWGGGDSDMLLVFADIVWVTSASMNGYSLVIRECLYLIVGLICSIAIGLIEGKVRKQEVNVTNEIAVIPGLSLVMILLMVQYFVWRWM
ncbi:MAG: hypothetical protein PHN80_15920 [Hespellia sp.]|nr:hypothetical protein [Hespellia sp.]